MKRYSVLILIAIIILFQNSFAQLVFEKGEYQTRREKFMEAVEDGIAVFLGAQPPASFHPFFQSNDFLYLTGVEMPNCILIVDGIHKESHLFFTITEHQARNDGVPLELVRYPQKVTGIEHIHALEDFEPVLKTLAQKAEAVYTMFEPEENTREASLSKKRIIERNRLANPWDNRKSREGVFIEYLEKLFPDQQIKDCSRAVWDLRIIKSPAEIELLRRAGRMTVRAHKEMMRSTRAGIRESELAGLFWFYLKKEGAHDLAYETIVCSAENHPYLHYYKHDRILQDGDFLVIDGGPRYHYYCIDITVSYPANGVFTERQKYIYTVSNAMHQACMQIYRPGLSREQAEKEVRAIMLKQGFDLEDPMFSQRGMNYVFGHYVGLAVHDAGGMPDTLRAGMVLANEPFAVFADENLGVRVESTILITETGCENLTPGLPRTVEEIEAFMQQKGAVQVLEEAGVY